jgi:hypothetical protein
MEKKSCCDNLWRVKLIKKVGRNKELNAILYIKKRAKEINNNGRYIVDGTV